MSITWGERPNSLSKSSTGFSRGYVLSGTSDKDIAYSLSVGYTPMLSSGYYRSNITCEQKGPDFWHVDVSYGPWDKADPVIKQEYPEHSWSFDTTGKTVHIDHGLAAATSYVPAGKTATNHKMAIGVQDDGRCEGTDIVAHGLKWTENHQLLLANYAWNYAQALSTCTGKVNSQIFRGCAAGTVLFQGASGGPSTKNPLYCDLTYHFEFSPYVTNVVVGDITVTTKPGWYYAWTRFEKTEDGPSYKETQKPCQVDVIKVYDTVDFAVLGIGTT